MGMQDWGIEVFAALAAIFALGGLQRFIYGFDHRWMRNRHEALVRSVSESRSASTRDPSIVVGSGWYVALWGALGAQLICLILWLILADSLAQQAPRFVAYVVAFFTAIGVLAMCLEGIVLYLGYRRLLRQAEAD